MKNFDTPYVDNNTYPKRLDDCLESLCQQAGLVLGSKNFPNNSYMIKGNPFTNGETRKTVLSNLVQLTGGFAEVDIEDGKLYVRNLDVGGEPVETIDGNNYDEFKPNNVFGPVNSIKLLMNSSVEGEETIKEADGVTDENRCQITIADNYYLTSAEERETVINGIFNALNGLTYLPVEINYYGYPWLKLGSKIKVKDKNDNEYVTYVMEHTLKYNGAYSGKIKATALTKTQVAYKETSSLKQFKRNTELAVDKINGKITQLTEETTENTQKITKTEQDVNGLTTKVSSVEQSVENITNTQGEAEGKNIHIEDSSEEPFVDISLHGESTQNGTPTPDNKVDIENIEGKNKFKNNYEAGHTTTNNGVTFTVNKDKSITANGTATDTVTFIFATNIKLKKGTCTVSGITSGSSSTYNITISGLTSIYNVARTHTINADTTYANAFIRVNSGVTVDNVTFYPMIEEGTVATEYVPYNSLEVKVEGKNIWNKSELSEKPSTVNIGVGELNVKDVPIPFTFSSYLISNALTDTNVRVSFMDSNNSNIGAVKFGNTITSTNKRSFITINEIPEGTVKIKFAVRMQDGGHTEKTQLEKGELTDYEPYKSQVATFPLGGEKLMEGSYLADDGIHHTRKQIVFDGSDDEDWQIESTNNFYSNIVIQNSKSSSLVLCNYQKSTQKGLGESENCFISTSKKFNFQSDTINHTVADFKTWLSTHNLIVEYELAEPEVVPYTAEQQEAWNKIKAMYTYKNITNITSDAYAKIIYMRDNGLDVYETKQNAEKNYTKTTKKLAEQKITVDEISQEVTNVNENLKGNYYTKTETNSKINEKADSITSEVSKTYSTKTETETAKTEAINSANSSTDNKLNDYTETSKLGTFIEQNYEHVKVAWNQISEFIQMMILNSNASLAILDGSKKPLMALDKTGMHFYNFSEQEIGNIGINNAEISFYVNGDVSGSSMSWGICKTVNGEKKYFQVFSYEGYNTEEGTEFGGKFLLEAPLIMQENTLFLGQSINSSYIQGQETDGRKKTTIGNTDDLYIYNTNGDLIFVLNSSYLKLYEQLEMYADPLATGGYAFNLMDNTLVGIDSISASGEISSNNGTFNDIPNSDNVRRFNNTGTDYLIAVLKSSAGGGSIYCQNANSDKKFKKNIKDTEIKALDIIKQIQHRQFDWKENGKHEKIGFIAQELEKINPCLINVIKENDEKTYLLNEKAILATVTKAIQEQQKEIEDLKKEIEKLKENKIEEV